MNEWMNELGDGNDHNNWQGVSNPYPPRNAKKFCMTEWDRWHSCSECKFHVFWGINIAVVTACKWKNKDWKWNKILKKLKIKTEIKI